MRTRKNAHKKNAHKKNAHKRRTNKSVKRRKTRTLTRKRSYKYQRRGGVGTLRSATARAAAVPEAAAAAEMKVEIGRFYILAPDQEEFTPVYLTRSLIEGNATEIMAQSLPPENYPHKIYSARGDSQIESMIKENFIGEVKIDNMIDNGDSITFSGAGYRITLHKHIGAILKTIKSNYGLK